MTTNSTMPNAMQSDDAVHQAVRQRYATIITSAEQGTGSTSCCNPSADTAAELQCCSSVPTLYESLQDLPADITSLSLGCGDPVATASFQAGETVLDLGSGAGMDCFIAARQVGPTGQVIGVDMTPEMLAKARANQAKLGLPQVEFRQGQIEALPVESDSIDAIMSNCVINLSPNKPAVFHEAFRVLKSGGRISISDIVTHGDFSSELRAQLDKWAECVTGAISVEEYTGMMHEAGFVDIQVVNKFDPNAVVPDLIPLQEGMPTIFSARITARKP